MLARFLANAAALAVATWLLPGIVLQDGPIERRVIAMLVVTTIFGVVNSIVKPLFKLVSSPVILLTLGLFLLVVNAAMLLLTSWAADKLGAGWHVNDLGAALLGALIVSVVSFLVNATLSKKGHEHR
jgi:putative membrane protein